MRVEVVAGRSGVTQRMAGYERFGGCRRRKREDSRMQEVST